MDTTKPRLEEILAKEVTRLYESGNTLLKQGCSELGQAYTRKAAKTANSAMLAFVNGS